MSKPNTLPAGVRAPLTADNEDDHSGLIVVLTSFYLVLSLASVSARVFTLYRKRIVQVDDYVFAGLVIVAFTQASVVLGQVHDGWGTRAGPRSAGSESRMYKAGYAADILSIMALGLSKISTSLFYGALFSQLKRWVIQTVLSTTITWTLVSIFLVSIRCSSEPWYDVTSQCNGLFPRWQTITALDVVTEALLVAYTGWAIHNVRIPFSKKVMVFLALGCRIVLIPLSALRLHYLHSQLHSPTPTLVGAYATTATEVYLSLSIVCQITSSLKFIIAVYEDKDGISYTDGSAKSAKSLGKSGESSGSSGSKSRSYSFGHGFVHVHNHGHSLGHGHGFLHRGAGVEDRDRARLVGNPEDGVAAGSGTGASSAQPGGLKILRSVQWSVEDEAIELDERGKAGEREVY